MDLEKSAHSSFRPALWVVVLSKGALLSTIQYFVAINPQISLEQYLFLHSRRSHHGHNDCHLRDRTFLACTPRFKLNYAKRSNSSSPLVVAAGLFLVRGLFHDRPARTIISWPWFILSGKASLVVPRAQTRRNRGGGSSRRRKRTRLVRLL